MAVPRNRLSNARKNSRRSHHAKKPRTTSLCLNCGKARLPHHVCGGCGYYGSRAVVKVDQGGEA
jgi:large subunit ribosomal protein L32